MKKFYFHCLFTCIAAIGFVLEANAQCEAGVLLTTTEVTVNTGETFNVMVENEVIPLSGGYGFIFDNTNTNGTGGLDGEFILSGTTTDENFDSNIGGLLTGNGFPPFEGTWIIRGAAYSDQADAFGSICSTTADSIIVNFITVAVPCEAGILVTTGTIDVPDGETFDLEATEASIPTLGTYAWLFDNTNTNGTGGIGAPLTLGSFGSTSTLDNDLAGVLSGNNFPILEGTWVVRGMVFNDTGFMDLCSVTADSLIVVFGEPDTTCISGQLLTTGTETLCGADANFTVMATESSPPSGGGFGYLIENTNTDGSGGPNIDFVFANVSETEDLNADLSGLLSSNSLPPLQGAWVVKAVSFSNASNPGTTTCSISSDSLIIVFSPDIELSLNNQGNTEVIPDISGGVAPFSYVWSNGETTEIATDLSDGDLSLVVTDAAGCTSESTISLLNTSVEDIPGLLSYELGPNPTIDRSILELRFEKEQQLSISILSLDGRVSKVLVNEKSTGGSYNLDLTDYSAGTYILHIVTDQGQYGSRIIKQ